MYFFNFVNSWRNNSGNTKSFCATVRTSLKLDIQQALAWSEQQQH
jgi:hypothetical protein